MIFFSSFGAWCTFGVWHEIWNSVWNGAGISDVLPFHLGPSLQIALIGMAAYVIMRRLTTPVATPVRGQSRTDILKRRYALGELDQETFVRMMKKLG